MIETIATQPATRLSQEQLDLLESLRRHRMFLKVTLRGLTDQQAGLRTTASALCLGGIVKHVTQGERNWVDFILGGAEAMMHGRPDWDPQEWTAGHRMLPGETLAGLVDGYDAVAARTDAVVQSVDLDATRPLPAAPWFQPGSAWSARRVLLHLIAETSQHAGHADIIRESLDGAQTMA